MVALNATLILSGPKGQRSIAAAKFFHGTYLTEMHADEILTEIHVKPFSAKTGSAYCKLKRKTGDWATAAAAVVLEMSGGTVTAARIALTNVARPHWMPRQRQQRL